MHRAWRCLNVYVALHLFLGIALGSLEEATAHSRGEHAVSYRGPVGYGRLHRWAQLQALHLDGGESTNAAEPEVPPLDESSEDKSVSTPKEVDEDEENEPGAESDDYAEEDNEETKLSEADTGEAKSSASGAEEVSSVDEDPVTSEDSEEDRELKYPRLSPGLIVAIAFGAVLATAIPLLLCCLCGCVSCIKVDWLNPAESADSDGAALGSSTRLARSSSRKSTVDCRHSECGSFHVSVDSADQEDSV